MVKAQLQSKAEKVVHKQKVDCNPEKIATKKGPDENVFPASENSYKFELLICGSKD